MGSLMRVLMISPRHPEETFWKLDGSVRQLTGRKGTMAPLGLLTVAAQLPEDFEIRLVDRNLASESDADWRWADVVFLSLMLAQQPDYRECLERARAFAVPVAVGGPYTSAMRESALAEADWVCFGEAESVMEELLADLRAGRRGRSYEGGNETHMPDLPTPRYDLLPDIDDYYVMPVQFSRGCPFDCEFCDIIEIYGRTPRTKAPAQVLAELDAIRGLGFSGCIFVVDDNFIGNRKRAAELLEALIGWNARHDRPFFYFTEASINLADHPGLVDAMAAADFLFVFIGIETPDPQLVLAAGKRQNASGDTLERLQRIREHGIHVIAGMIVGFDDERRDVFERQLAFVAESGIGIVMVGLLQALPNTRLWRRLQAEGRLLEGQKVNLNHTVEGMNFVPRGELSKREYLRGMIRATDDLYEPAAFFERITKALLSLRKRQRPPLRWDYVRNFLRLALEFGVRDADARAPFWRALWAVARGNPAALGAFYYDCFHYRHLKEHRRAVASSFQEHLSNPPPGDVLDRVSGPPAPLPAAATPGSEAPLSARAG
jgi:radical SAM superfamily enzyme YgiQ (UPF0313 family)